MAESTGGTPGCLAKFSSDLLDGLVAGSYSGSGKFIEDYGAMSILGLLQGLKNPRREQRNQDFMMPGELKSPPPPAGGGAL